MRVKKCLLFFAIILLIGCSIAKSKTISGSNIELLEMQIVTSKNKGIVDDIVIVNIKYIYSTNFDISGFCVKYPKNEISEYIRQCVKKDQESVKKMLRNDSENPNRIEKVEQRKCLIEISPVFNKKIEKSKKQMEKVSFSIPSNYFHYVGFFVKSNNKIKGITSPNDVRTYVIHIPDNQNNVIKFISDNLNEVEWNGVDSDTVFKEGEEAKLWKETYFPSE